MNLSFHILGNPLNKKVWKYMKGFGNVSKIGVV